MDETDALHMARAVRLAALGRGTTSPNPVVGCVIVDASGAHAGEGFHAYAGGPHAEVVALSEAGERARGGTAYVTLEPCAHTGRTGPCSEALLKAGVARVVIAVPDPNPTAAGGAAQLRAHGRQVEIGLLAEEAERGNAEWLTFIRRGRPHVTWKFAATLDGRSAAEDGTSQWITSPEARADVHRLRAESDAIVAGIGTVLADDPRLTARPPASGPVAASPPAAAPSSAASGPTAGSDPGSVLSAGSGSAAGGGPAVVSGPVEPASRPAVRGLGPAGGGGPYRQPLRVVVDTGGRTPVTARVLSDEAPTLVAVADDAETDLPAPVVRLPRSPAGGLDLHALLAELARRGVVSVFLEGGATLAGSFMREGLIDRVVAYLAPALLGSGGAALGHAGVRTIADTHRLVFEEVTPIGTDLRITARPVTEES
ncbi:bifunctional diaminohydroxyphosphoribosylaminopyrimidine deaminase/5-amino-6-(5-phosphoribosylamino)uracil reductase RibD [Nonomuraea sp. NPDC003804]|uniref:bifunctional diaminohydroxyphosphoribosylaminopyrimidine deaminase/5-amino-6-(5-phosphoribosylamino)uracil reductase RibD n=1 Tax=Nonomuraea sp. NPDC003804 TaxID=3154547 RepID=UPI0033B3A75F